MRTLLAAALLAAAVPAGAAGKPGLPWIEDDWDRALAQAKARDLPVVVDVWTPW